MAVNAHELSALSVLFKYHFGEAVDHLVTQFSEMWDRCKKKTQPFGGRKLIFPYEIKRANNVGWREASEFLPGMSSTTNDDIDRLEAVEAELSRKRVYSSLAFDGLFTQDVHGKFLFKKGHNFTKHVTYMAEDLAREMNLAILGDETGIRAIVDTVEASLVGGNTQVNLKPVSAYNVRGVGGTQRLQGNMKLARITAAHLATSATASQADSATCFKVVDVSEEFDVGAAPYALLKGDVRSAIAAGDALVGWNSRTQTAGGSASGATLKTMQGILNWVDDGTLNDSFLGLSRTSYPILNSKVDLASSIRALDHLLLQRKVDALERRLGHNKAKVKRLKVFSESGLRTAYADRIGEGAKRYAQEAKGALKATVGFSDVQLVFLGNDSVMPWVCDRDFPYQNIVVMDESDIRIMQDKPLGPLDKDGLTLRQVTGKDEWVMFYGGYLEAYMQEPWHAIRYDALEGEY